MSGSRSWRASSNSFRALAMSLSRHTTPSLSWCQGSTGQRVRKWGTARRRRVRRVAHLHRAPETAAGLLQ